MTSSSKDIHDLGVSYAVDDKKPQWLYYGVKRSKRDRKKHPLHKKDQHMPSRGAETLIRDGRVHLEQDISTGKIGDLDTIGFELVQHETSFSLEEFYKLPEFDPSTDFVLDEKSEDKRDECTTSSEEEAQNLRRRLYRETEIFLEKHLKATCVVVFNHQVNIAAGKQASRLGGYVRNTPHTDSNHLSGDETYLWLASSHPKLRPYKDDAKRYMCLNLWQNIAEYPIQDSHLALLDDRSIVKPDSFVPYELHGPGFDIIENGLNYRWSHKYKWYYFPDMTKDEAVLYKLADCDYTKNARSCFHMSIEDLNLRENFVPPPRQHIEFRCMALFTDESFEKTVPTEETISGELLHYEGVPRGLSKTPAGKHNCLFIPFIDKFLKKRADASSQNPQFYVAKLVVAMAFFHLWSVEELVWSRRILLQMENETRAIEVFTTGLIMDCFNDFGMKYKSATFKASVRNSCLQNEAYMETIESFKNHLRLK